MVTVSTAAGTPAEEATRERLLALLDRHLLEAITIAEDIVIEEGAVPHSHPRLTLAAPVSDDVGLLCDYLHEQAHWWSLACPGALDRRDEVVFAQLDPMAAAIPIGPPLGCDSKLSNVIHLHVCWLERDLLAQLMGDERAEEAIARKGYYRRVYEVVLQHRPELDDLFRSNGMGAPPLRPRAT